MMESLRVVGQVPALWMVAAASEVLLQSSRQWLAAGVASADVPLLIEAAVNEARSRLAHQGETTPPETLSVLGLWAPEALFERLQSVVTEGGWSDVLAMIPELDTVATSLEYPDELVSAALLQRLAQILTLEPAEAEVVRLNLDSLQKTMAERAGAAGIPMAQVQVWQQDVADRVADLDPPTLWQLVSVYLVEEEALPPPPPTVAGPLLYLEISEFLLAQEDAVLTPDQRLDLQINAGRAEARLQAMLKLGKITDVEAERQPIREWMQQHSAADLLSYLSLWFPS
ncbi:MAG: hypothetical protein OHK0012_25890 [Synechococcales cyanobacterium]